MKALPRRNRLTPVGDAKCWVCAAEAWFVSEQDSATYCHDHLPKRRRWWALLPKGWK